jgi:PAS domain S-box-containing protein
MNSWFFTILSGFNSPVVSVLMSGVLILHIPIARKQSGRKGMIYICLSAGWILVLLAELLVKGMPGQNSLPFEATWSVVKLLFILASFSFLVRCHIRLINEIRHLEDKFLKVFNTSPHGMMIVKVSDATVKEVNSAFVRVSGYSAEEVIGKTTLELGLWQNPQQRDEVISFLMNYESFGPVEFKFIPKTGIPTKYFFTAQFIIIEGEKYLVAHIEEKHDRSSSGNEAKKLLNQKLREIMTEEELFKVPGLTLSDLAEKLDTNKTYLSQVINSEYGNFNEYLNKLRVIEACRLIQHGLDPKFSIDHLYSKVGFSSRTTFYATFKKFTGVSPSRFRQITDTESKNKS